MSGDPNPIGNQNPFPPGSPGNPHGCGGVGQPPCPPQPALTGAPPLEDPNTPLYSYAEMLAHSWVSFEAGKAHQAQKSA